MQLIFQGCLVSQEESWEPSSEQTLQHPGPPHTSSQGRSPAECKLLWGGGSWSSKAWSRSSSPFPRAYKITEGRPGHVHISAIDH